jgi:hypothetical protein
MKAIELNEKGERLCGGCGRWLPLRKFPRNESTLTKNRGTLPTVPERCIKELLPSLARSVAQ